MRKLAEFPFEDTEVIHIRLVLFPFVGMVACPYTFDVVEEAAAVEMILTMLWLQAVEFVNPLVDCCPIICRGGPHCRANEL